jgi:hypothetical protein
MALGGAMLLIYATLHKRPAPAGQARRRHSDDGKVIYLFNDRSEGEGAQDGDSEASGPPNGEFTDVEFSEVKAEEPNEDREK